MTRPNIGATNAATGETWERQMTDEEYAELLASGWTEEGLDNALGSHADVQHPA